MRGGRAPVRDRRTGWSGVRRGGRRLKGTVAQAVRSTWVHALPPENERQNCGICNKTRSHGA